MSRQDVLPGAALPGVEPIELIRAAGEGSSDAARFSLVGNLNI